MDILKSLLGSIVREYVTDKAMRGLAAHANRQKAGAPLPTSASFGWLSMLLGLAAVVIVVPIAVLMWATILIGKPFDGAWIAAPLFGVVAIWFCIAFYDGFVRRIEWSETHVCFRKWNGDRTVTWDDITGLEEKSYPPHFRIAFRDGTGFAIVDTMKGSAHFLSIIANRLGPEDRDGGKRRRRRRRKSKR